ncbi:MAG TPA: trypsin-like peptidase domain-containing protein [Candidatus Solibacter sp.]|nr:trypsin-like peptidase domain-containing protein [Candidatus Solibacter sp.]
MAVGVLVGAIIGGAAGATLVADRQKTGNSNGTPYIAAPNASGGSTTASGISAAAIYQQTSPGVVVIVTELSANFRNVGEATGSGIVLNNSGDILTNEHVVAGARQIRVTFKDGTTVAGTVAGTDASDDLAVVHVTGAASHLHPLVLANSDAAQIGDPVLAIGTPFGLSGSLTSGIVSGLGRSSTSPSGRALTGMIQTDAPINPGNSGGPLLNAKGEVLGVDESIQSPVQGSVGVGFAVPINTAKRVISNLEAGKAVQHPWLGISGQTITQSLADSLSLPKSTGVLVVQVVTGSPAAKAGLVGTGSADSGDDIITAMDGHQLASVEALTTYLDSKNVGDKVTMTVVRGSKTMSLTATLADFQQQPGG